MLAHATHRAPFDVVLVHGAGGNNALWRRTLNHLGGDSRALAVNLPGHPGGVITCKTVKEYSESVQEFIAKLGVSRPAICGHSMGSAVALRLAIDHPEDVGGLVLVSGGAKLGVGPAIVSGLRSEPMKTIEKMITPMSFYKVDLGLGREARGALSISNLPVFLNDYLACQGFDVRAELPKVAARTMIICGDRDRMTPPKWSHYLNEHILHSEIRFVRDSGHMLPLEKPLILSGLIQSFLEGLNP